MSERLPMSEAPDPHGGSDEPLDLVTDPAPGTAEPVADDGDTSTDGSQKTDTGTPPPANVPYSRFKEVIDARKASEERLQPYLELESLGYPADELQRLTQWETEFINDPVSAWIATAESIQDLPDSIKEAIAAHKGEAPPPPSVDRDAAPKPTDESTQEDVPAWAQKLIERDEARQQAEQQAAERAQAEANRSRSQEILAGMIETWKAQDEKDGVTTPPRTMLAHLMAAARVSQTPDEAVALARKDWLEDREASLGDVIKRPTTGLRTVPGGGPAPPGQPPRVARTLKEATKLATAEMSAGERRVGEE